MNLYRKQKQTYRKQIYGYQKGERDGKTNQEYNQELYMKQICSIDLLCRAGNYVQYVMITYNGI